LFSALPVVVRVEELPVGGKHVTADGRLLVTKCGLQPVCRYPRRLNVVDQLPGHLVGAVEQDGTGNRAREHQHTHDGQNQVLPSLHGKL
jgi:hypothetical protein